MYTQLFASQGIPKGPPEANSKSDVILGSETIDLVKHLVTPKLTLSHSPITLINKIYL